MISIGWDVSTSVIGVCAKKEDGTSVFYEAIKIKGDTMIEKYSYAVKAVNIIVDYLKSLDSNRKHIVEDRLGNFSKGATTLDTLMKLAQMNAVVSYILSLDAKVTHIHPSTTKRIIGLKKTDDDPEVIDKKTGKWNKKLAVVKLARISDPLFPFKLTPGGNFVAGVEDMADAFALAKAGLLIESGEAEIAKTKKTSRNKGKTRSAKAVKT